MSKRKALPTARFYMQWLASGGRDGVGCWCIYDRMFSEPNAAQSSAWEAERGSAMIVAEARNIYWARMIRDGLNATHAN